MDAKFRNEISIGGHSLDVLKSGMQKYIRRGMEEEALYCVAELDSFADLGHPGERIRSNMIHRLMIIFLEDIGLGNYLLFEKMDEWISVLIKERKKKDRSRVLEIATLEVMVRNLCKSKKTRAGSFMNSLFQLRESNLLALKGTGYDYIIQDEDIAESLEEALENKSWKAIIYTRRMIEDKKIFSLEKILKKYMNIGREIGWKKEIKTKESFLLHLMPVGCYLYGTLPLQLDEDCEEYYGEWPFEYEVFEFDQWVYDKHTRGGYGGYNKTSSYFVNVSSVVIPEVFVVPKEMKKIYEYIRGNKVPVWDVERESDFTFVTRIQLICGKSKTDTYYAKDGDSLLFIKGPFITDKPVDDFISIQEMKKERCIPYIKDARKMMLYPDRWPEGTPMGLRTKTDINKKYPFLVCGSMCDIGEINLITHPGSKMWPPTQVVDTSKFSMDIFSLKNQAVIDYLEVIAFRLEHNIGDLAERNFIIKDGRVYSVDEEYTKTKINFSTALSKKKVKYLCSLVEKHKELLSKKALEIYAEWIE